MPEKKTKCESWGCNAPATIFLRDSNMAYCEQHRGDITPERERIKTTIDPCPFCGGDQLEIEGDRIRNWIICHGCDAAGPVQPGALAAVASWNHREAARAKSTQDESAPSNTTPLIRQLDEAVAYLERYNPAANGRARARIVRDAIYMINNPRTLATETLGYRLARDKCGEFEVWVAPYLWQRHADAK